MSAVKMGSMKVEAVAEIGATGLGFSRFARALGAMALAATFAVGPARAGDSVDVKVDYVISLGTIAIGHVDAESHFTPTGYDTTISGSTSGIVRMVTDASATLIGSGRIAGHHILPDSYSLDTRENGLRTHVEMSMRGNRITKLDAEPHLPPAPDRVPLTAAHKRNVFDPVSSFLIAVNKPGEVPARACDRTVHIFDGWERYDVKLYFKGMKAVDANAGSYAGPVVVCGARYVPVAGHRKDREQVQFMAKNKRMEVWLAPIEGLPLLVPYRILIGTQVGDLLISATRFATDTAERHASAD
jgi:hypothetical protein